MFEKIKNSARFLLAFIFFLSVVATFVFAFVAVCIPGEGGNSMAAVTFFARLSFCSFLVCAFSYLLLQKEKLMQNFLDLLFGKKKVAQRSKPKTEQPSPDPTDASQITSANTPEGFVRSSEKLSSKQKAEQEEKEGRNNG